MVTLENQHLPRIGSLFDLNLKNYNQTKIIFYQKETSKKACNRKEKLTAAYVSRQQSSICLTFCSINSDNGQYWTVRPLEADSDCLWPNWEILTRYELIICFHEFCNYEYTKKNYRILFLYFSTRCRLIIMRLS